MLISGKMKVRARGTNPVDPAMPVRGFKSRISVDRALRREGPVILSDAARAVWAGSACFPPEAEDRLEARGMVSRIFVATTYGRLDLQFLPRPPATDLHGR